MSKRKHKRAGGSSLILVIIIVMMIITNPGKDEFFDWAQNRALKNSETVVGGAITNMFMSPLLRTITVRQDYLLFSIYKLEVEGSHTVWIGVFKQFIEIKLND